jgi:LysM repeat protein
MPATHPAGASAAGAPAEPAAAPVAGDPRVAGAQQKLAAGQVLEARQELNSLLRDGALSGRVAAEVRTLLAGLADQTVFARKLTPGDPLQESHTIQPGDRLIHIARKLDLPHEILMEINKIHDAGTIRADQKIKLLHGPFHARIYKSDFRLDLYLGDLYVRSYAVGLGADPGTPEGAWKVKDRLPNPTYYPSASATEKRIIAPDDPDNPLGEYWIGLEGVEGDAVGHDGYGIHGTIEPESIGKAVSLGCVRMHNEDVAFVYKCLLPGKSTVTVLP